MRVGVFCGSSDGTSPAYLESARELGSRLGAAGIGVVYGGNVKGLMGAVADSAMAAGGTVTGVIPVGLFSKEMPHPDLTELIEVASMHERKTRMYDLADAFIGLPGGLGTLEEVAEISTWAQLGLHAKPVVVVDVDGFWRPLLEWLDGAVAAGFIKPVNRRIITSAPTVADAVRLVAPLSA
ncbi:MAG: TIGR00730 family Rossman fold protein [Acidimicrobiales bacterium]